MAGRMRGWKAVAVVAAAVTAAIGVVEGVDADGGPAPAIDPIVKVASGDPLELGRFVEKHGDRYVLLRLRAEHPADTRLAAVRAAPWLDAPERALVPLAHIAAGRDPELAPAAAWSAYRIATSLDPIALGDREVLWSDIAPARALLRHLAADATARPDIRRVAAFAADALAHLDPSRKSPPAR